MGSSSLLAAVLPSESHSIRSTDASPPITLLKTITQNLGTLL